MNFGMVETRSPDDEQRTQQIVVLNGAQRIEGPCGFWRTARSFASLMMTIDSKDKLCTIL